MPSVIASKAGRWWGRQLHVDERHGGYCLCWPDGEVFYGPYKRAQDVKGLLTRLVKNT